MKTNSFLGQWLLALVLTVGAANALPAQTPAAAAPVPAQPRLVAPFAQTMTRAGYLQDIVGNRTRLIQASFVCILIGIFILWKK